MDKLEIKVGERGFLDASVLFGKSFICSEFVDRFVSYSSSATIFNLKAPGCVN